MSVDIQYTAVQAFLNSNAFSDLHTDLYTVWSKTEQKSKL